MPIALVVEDDEDIRLLYHDVLSRNGFICLIAARAREAIKLLETHTPDIAFVDMNMPDHPGTDVIAYIKNTPRLAHTKTVLVTANRLADQQLDGYAIDLYLAKPVPIAELISTAQRLTEA